MIDTKSYGWNWDDLITLKPAIGRRRARVNYMVVIRGDSWVTVQDGVSTLLELCDTASGQVAVSGYVALRLISLELELTRGQCTTGRWEIELNDGDVMLYLFDSKGGLNSVHLTGKLAIRVLELAMTVTSTGVG